jgi:cytochrome c
MELPAGSGTAEQGRRLYLQKRCARCHGPDGTDGDAPRLLAREGQPGEDPWRRGRVLPVRAPYATAVWDYINRGMPLGDEGSLTADEVYAITAYLLSINGVIAEDAVMDQESLPLVQMPNRDNWAPLPDWAPGQPRWPGYPH